MSQKEDGDEGESPEKADPAMSLAIRRAGRRIRRWKDAVRECEQAKEHAVALLEDCSARMAKMIERQEIGTRKCSDGQSYPQLRVVYWGEIETGSMSMLCVEIDYGDLDRARVGIWAKLRAFMDSTALGGVEKMSAWWRGWNLGKPSGVESAWLEIKACLKALAVDLEYDLSYASESALPSFDEKAWGEWVSKQGDNLIALSLPVPEHMEEPSSTDEEWQDLGRQARALLTQVKIDALGLQSKAKPPEGGDAGDGRRDGGSPET